MTTTEVIHEKEGFKPASDKWFNNPCFKWIPEDSKYEYNEIIPLREIIKENDIKRPDTPEADNWLYMSTEEKKQAVIDSGEYECFDDYFIAYKAVKKDYYSLRNFIDCYKPGNIVTAPNADCTHATNSFGISGWTVENAKEYFEDGALVKIKIKYEDLARVLPDHKVRAFKVESLEDVSHLLQA